jgi:prophage regulatory protein
MSSRNSAAALSVAAAPIPPETQQSPDLVEIAAQPTFKERLISEREVLRRTSFSKSTRWRLEKAGAFPRSVQISRGRRAWRESEIDAWIAEKN